MTARTRCSKQRERTKYAMGVGAGYKEIDFGV